VRVREQEALEVERKSRAFQNFFELTNEQVDSIKDRVAAFKGHARIVVHPYAGEFPFGMIPEERRIRPEKEEAINRALLRWADASVEDSPPILIFEEEDRIDDLMTRLEKQTELNNQFYIVPTFSMWSDIKLSPGEQIGKADHWGDAIKKLKGLGVTNIIVGGKYLSVVDSPNHESGRVLSACVGNVLNRLSPMFDVELSHLSYSDSRKELKEIEMRRGAHDPRKR